MLFSLMKIFFVKQGLRLASVVVFVLMMLYRAFRFGANSERDKQQAASDSAKKERARNDQKIRSYSNDRVRSELSKWVRKDDV